MFQAQESILFLGTLNNNLIVAATADGLLSLIDHEGEFLNEKQVFSLSFSSMEVDPMGELIACGGEEPTLKVLRGETLATEFEYKFSSRAWVQAVAWSKDGKFLAVSCGKELVLFRRDGTVHRVYEKLTHSIANIQFRQDEPEFLVSFYDGVFTFRPEGPVPRRKFNTKAGVLKALWSPNGKFIAAGTQSNSLHCWNVETRKDFEMTGFITKVKELSWHHSGAALAVGGGGSITIWDFRKGPPIGKQPVELTGHVDFISHLEFSHDGDALLSGGHDGQVFYWEPTMEEPKRIANHEGAVSAITWSRDNSKALYGFADGSLEITGF